MRHCHKSKKKRQATPVLTTILLRQVNTCGLILGEGVPHCPVGRQLQLHLWQCKPHIGRQVIQAVLDATALPRPLQVLAAALRRAKVAQQHAAGVLYLQRQPGVRQPLLLKEAEEAAGKALHLRLVIAAQLLALGIVRVLVLHPLPYGAQ